MKKKERMLWLGCDFLLFMILVGLDQWTKHLVSTHLKGNAAIVILKNVFELDYLENRGSAFGMFQNKKIFLLVVGVLLMGIIIFELLRIPLSKRFLQFHVMFSFLAAGGIGNMIDRIWNGYVVDFFSFVLIHFPIFNVADVYIVVAAFMIGILMIFVYKEEELTFLWPSRQE